MPRCIWRSRCLTTSTPRRVESSSGSDCPAVVVGRVRRSRHPAKWRHNRKCPCSHYVWQDHNVWQGYNFYVNSGQIALPVDLLRYVSYGAGSAQGAASRRRPLYPRAPASNIATAWCLRLIPAGFGSGRGSVRAKHGPQPASMRAAPAFRERLSDVEAATPAVSARLVNKLTTGRTIRRPGKAQPPPGKLTVQQDRLGGELCLPGGAALARAYRI